MRHATAADRLARRRATVAGIATLTDQAVRAAQARGALPAPAPPPFRHQAAALLTLLPVDGGYLELPISGLVLPDVTPDYLGDDTLAGVADAKITFRRALDDLRRADPQRAGQTCVFRVDDVLEPGTARARPVLRVWVVTRQVYGADKMGTPGAAACWLRIEAGTHNNDDGGT